MDSVALAAWRARRRLERAHTRDWTSELDGARAVVNLAGRNDR